MDIQQFGGFIQKRRKELGMTQSELGAKLHITDKAISRWERGIGLPDVKLLEPLADALEISVQELMKCERIESVQDAQMVQDDSVVQQSKTGRFFEKYRRAFAVLCFISYALLLRMSWNPSNAEWLRWVSPLTRVLFLVTIGAFLYASYKENSHGIH